MILIIFDYLFKFDILELNGLNKIFRNQKRLIREDKSCLPKSKTCFTWMLEFEFEYI